VESVITVVQLLEGSKVEQTNERAPPKFGTVKQALTAVVRVTLVLPKRG